LYLSSNDKNTSTWRTTLTIADPTSGTIDLQDPTLMTIPWPWMDMGNMNMTLASRDTHALMVMAHQPLLEIFHRRP
jgi:hypothetical protein